MSSTHFHAPVRRFFTPTSTPTLTANALVAADLAGELFLKTLYRHPDREAVAQRLRDTYAKDDPSAVGSAGGSAQQRVVIEPVLLYLDPKHGKVVCTVFDLLMHLNRDDENGRANLARSYATDFMHSAESDHFYDTSRVIYFYDQKLTQTRTKTANVLDEILGEYTQKCVAR